jgi:hypothetical protein
MAALLEAWPEDADDGPTAKDDAGRADDDETSAGPDDDSAATEALEFSAEEDSGMAEDGAAELPTLAADDDGPGEEVAEEANDREEPPVADDGELLGTGPEDAADMAELTAPDEDELTAPDEEEEDDESVPAAPRAAQWPSTHSANGSQSLLVAQSFRRARIRSSRTPSRPATTLPCACDASCLAHTRATPGTPSRRPLGRPGACRWMMSCVRTPTADGVGHWHRAACHPWCTMHAEGPRPARMGRATWAAAYRRGAHAHRGPPPQ